MRRSAWWERWSSWCAAVVLALLVCLVYGRWGDVVILERVSDVTRTPTTITATVSGVKALLCPPLALTLPKGDPRGRIRGYAMIDGERGPADARSVAPDNIRDYPLGWSRFGTFTWTLTDACEAEKVALSLKHDCLLGEHRTFLGDMDLPPCDPPSDVS